MKNCIIITTLLSSLWLANTANSTEPTEKLDHAVYVAFQTAQIFTAVEIDTAQQQVLDSANAGDEFAKRVAPKLTTKINKQALAQR